MEMSWYVSSIVNDINKATTHSKVHDILRDRIWEDGDISLRVITYVRQMIGNDVSLARYKRLCITLYIGYTLMDDILSLIDNDASISVRDNLPYMLGITMEEAFSFMDRDDLQTILDKEEDMSLVMMKHSSRLLAIVANVMTNI